MHLVPLLVNSTLILANLRAQFANHDPPLDAYIVPYGGAHYDERVAECDARIKFVSGFGGSAGSVIISSTSALLWTDGRYFSEAEYALYDNWALMKQGEPGVPTQAQWLIGNLTNGANDGVAGSTYPKSSFDAMSQALRPYNIILYDTEDLVVEVWENFPNSPRPHCPNYEVHDLNITFSGKEVREKLLDVRVLMENEGADVVLVSELEEVSWLLNLRGRDLPDASVQLQEYNAARYEYSELDAVLNSAAENATTAKIWLSKYVNAKLANLVPTEKQLIKLSPVMLMKSKKNPVEVQGMRDAHLRDSAAIVTFQSWLERQLNAGVTNITEVSASQILYDIRSHGSYFMGQSFTTIAGFGPNGAIIHYRPVAGLDATITLNDLFLLDSGGLYLDGTCDITRTMHFGTPTDEHKDRYTRVLKGHIALAKAIFPNKTPGTKLDSFARKALWDEGLDYKHGTGHGIGHYLNVHEGPQSISNGYAVDDSGLEENMFVSNEPGFYKVGQYGIRIENIARIAKAEYYEGFLGIETVSFVPLSRNLVNVDLLTKEEIEWVDNYHETCLEKVGTYIDQHNDYIGPEVREYLVRETAPLGSDDNCTQVVTQMVTDQQRTIQQLLALLSAQQTIQEQQVMTQMVSDQQQTIQQLLALLSVQKTIQEKQVMTQMVTDQQRTIQQLLALLSTEQKFQER